jgi:hypothetical protein
VAIAAICPNMVAYFFWVCLQFAFAVALAVAITLGVRLNGTALESMTTHSLGSFEQSQPPINFTSIRTHKPARGIRTLLKSRCVLDDVFSQHNGFVTQRFVLYDLSVDASVDVPQTLGVVG